jgi:uroporphyrinogen decarboxylase
MVTMTPKQRVYAALSYQESDRVPCNYIGTPEVDTLLKKHFKTDDMDVVLEKLNIDLRVINPVYAGPELQKWDDGRFEDYWGRILMPVRNEAGTYMEATDFPYARFETVADVENFRWPETKWFDFSSIASDCDKYADYAVILGTPGNMDLINGTARGRGVEKVLYDIALEDPVGLACMDKRFECGYAISEEALKAAAGKVDILWIGEDYGTQNGLLVSPDTWRKLFLPKLKAMCDLAHKYNAKLMLHCCGASRIIWPELIDAGVDIYDTVQPEAAGMQIDGLKKDFGSKIVMHGTISTQKTLPFGSTDDVRAEVQNRIKIASQGGGLILAPAHNIQPDTPLENILALYDEIHNS